MSIAFFFCFTIRRLVEKEDKMSSCVVTGKMQMRLKAKEMLNRCENN